MKAILQKQDIFGGLLNGIPCCAVGAPARADGVAVESEHGDHPRAGANPLQVPAAVGHRHIPVIDGPGCAVTAPHTYTSLPSRTRYSKMY